MDGSTLVSKIDTILKQRNIKRQALADFCGINVQSFADWTRRGTLPNIETGLKIAKFLGVSIEWLLDEDYENSWLPYDDKVTTHDIWMSPCGILRRIDILIREQIPVGEGFDPYDDEHLFDPILDIISIDQIIACYKNQYEPSMIQLFELAKRFNVSLEWLITGRDKTNIPNEDRYLLGLAKQYPGLLKNYHCLPEKDQKILNDLITNIFMSKVKIRDALVEQGIDPHKIPGLWV